MSTNKLLTSCGWEIAALLRALGCAVGLSGLANVLQCGIAKTALPKKVQWGKNLNFFCRVERSSECRKVSQFF